MAKGKKAVRKRNTVLHRPVQAAYGHLTGKTQADVDAQSEALRRKAWCAAQVPPQGGEPAADIMRQLADVHGHHAYGHTTMPPWAPVHCRDCRAWVEPTEGNDAGDCHLRPKVWRTEPDGWCMVGVKR